MGFLVEAVVGALVIALSLMRLVFWNPFGQSLDFRIRRAVHISLIIACFSLQVATFYSFYALNIESLRSGLGASSRSHFGLFLIVLNWSFALGLSLLYNTRLLGICARDLLLRSVFVCACALLLIALSPSVLPMFRIPPSMGVIFALIAIGISAALSFTASLDLFSKWFHKSELFEQTQVLLLTLAPALGLLVAFSFPQWIKRDFSVPWFFLFLSAIMFSVGVIEWVLISTRWRLANPQRSFSELEIPLMQTMPEMRPPRTIRLTNVLLWTSILCSGALREGFLGWISTFSEDQFGGLNSAPIAVGLFLVALTARKFCLIALRRDHPRLLGIVLFISTALMFALLRQVMRWGSPLMWFLVTMAISFLLIANSSLFFQFEDRTTSLILRFVGGGMAGFVGLVLDHTKRSVVIDSAIVCACIGAALLACAEMFKDENGKEEGEEIGGDEEALEGEQPPSRTASPPPQTLEQLLQQQQRRQSHTNETLRKWWNLTNIFEAAKQWRGFTELKREIAQAENVLKMASEADGNASITHAQIVQLRRVLVLIKNKKKPTPEELALQKNVESVLKSLNSKLRSEAEREVRRSRGEAPIRSKSAPILMKAILQFRSKQQ